jgi:predicted nuclease with TOPRIM domain
MDTLKELGRVRTEIIRKEAEIESISERLVDLTDVDDLHRAKTKFRHEKERLVELRCKCAELEIDVETLRLQAWNNY